MCSKSPAEYHGRYYDLPPSGTMPLPDSPPPVWIGGHTGPALRRAARWQGWHAFQLGPDEVAAAAAQLPDGVTISVRTRLDPDDMPGTVRHLEACERPAPTTSPSTSGRTSTAPKTPCAASPRITSRPWPDPPRRRRDRPHDQIRSPSPGETAGNRDQIRIDPTDTTP